MSALPHIRVGLCLGLVLIGAGAGAVGGCGNGRVSDQDTARGTVETFLAQCAAGRGVRVVELLNRSARTVFLDAGSTRAGCGAVLARRLSADQLRRATPRLTRFAGATAEFAVAPGSGAPAARLTVSQGSEGWQIEGPS
jgi:hypothetical protein